MPRIASRRKSLRKVSRKASRRSYRKASRRPYRKVSRKASRKSYRKSRKVSRKRSRKSYSKSSRKVQRRVYRKVQRSRSSPNITIQPAVAFAPPKQVPIQPAIPSVLAPAPAPARPAQFTVMSFNIQAFITSKQRQSVAQFIQNTNADVVCIQEDTADNKWPELSDRYYVAAQCTTAENLSNTILVQTKHKITDARSYDITRSCRTSRCGCSVNFYGHVITNVHLCGGRFDDRYYMTMTQSKAEELDFMVVAVNPDIVVGDFNAEHTPELAVRTLAKHPVYKNLSMADQATYLRYYISGHDYLKSHGYVPVIANENVSTSTYGGRPDWIYTRPNKYRISERVIDTIGPQLSDHNALLATFA